MVMKQGQGEGAGREQVSIDTTGVEAAGGRRTWCTRSEPASAGVVGQDRDHDQNCHAVYLLDAGQVPRHSKQHDGGQRVDARRGD